MAEEKGVNYACEAVWSEEDQQFVATCALFPSLSWLAETRMAALRGLEEMLVEVAADMRESGQPDQRRSRFSMASS
jgi:hypothetical protein